MFTPSNIVTENGDSFIPASQRPDGTWRKARRVKEGYVPQEEVPLYESKGKQFMNRVTQPQTVVLPSGEVARQPIPGLFIIEDPEKKTSKKKKNKVKQNVEEVTVKLQNSKITENKVKEKQPADALEVPLEKKIKNLKKKLREIESLEEKLKNGTIEKPEPEQLQKVKRKGDLLMQIRDLEKSMA